MRPTQSHLTVPGQISTSPRHLWLLIATSLACMLAAVAVSVFVPDTASKWFGMGVLLLAYLSICLAMHRGSTRTETRRTTEPGIDEHAAEVHLRILEEAAGCFAGSLDTGDAFRLLSSRVTDLVPGGTLTLLLFDPTRSHFVVCESGGTGYEKGSKIPADSSIVRRALDERDVVIDLGYKTAVVPLKRNAEVFALLIIEFTNVNDLKDVSALLLDAIGERAAPLILGATARERDRENALTDAATDLPNERAFLLVLENQVAEAIRRGGSRPLTILSFDISSFDDLTRRHGLEAGNEMLNFVAQSVKDDLRQMDFLARGKGGEFLTSMPTASREVSEEIIGRIQASLFGKKIKVGDLETVEVELNFGWASFGADGEAPAALIAAARERKEQSRSLLPGRVLWFPQEVVH